MLFEVTVAKKTGTIWNQERDVLEKEMQKSGFEQGGINGAR